MQTRYTQRALTQLEGSLLAMSYTLRYAKSNIEAGYCVVHEKRMVVLSKFLSLESKIDYLRAILDKLSAEQVAQANAYMETTTA